jgi:hypothetical protein
MALVACKRSRKSANGEQGQALLEFLPVIALLLVLAFGVIECSYAIWQLEVITALTREGSNLASRGAGLPCPAAPAVCPAPTLTQTLQASANSVISDGAALNLATNGEVIVTAVQNVSGTFLITAQIASGSFNGTSRVGTGVNSNATLPATATPIPLNGTLYVTEVFAKHSAITPLGAFVNFTMPSSLYDAAYFF